MISHFQPKAILICFWMNFYTKFYFSIFWIIKHSFYIGKRYTRVGYIKTQFATRKYPKLKVTPLNLAFGIYVPWGFYDYQKQLFKRHSSKSHTKYFFCIDRSLNMEKIKKNVRYPSSVHYYLFCFRYVTTISEGRINIYDTKTWRQLESCILAPY